MSGNSREDDNEDIWKERCLNCIKCNVTSDCGVCSACKAHKTCEARRCFLAKKLYQEKMNRQTAEIMKQIKAKTAVREAQASTSDNADFRKKYQEPEKKKRGRKKGSTTAATRKITEDDYAPSRPTRQQAADLRRKRTQVFAEPNKLPRQCLNPDCILEARYDSKYCSDDCGKALARMKLVEILPTRCKEYFAGSETLEESWNQKKIFYNNESKKLTEAEQCMNRFIDKLHDFVDKFATVEPHDVDERTEDNVYEACIVCGATDVPLRLYAKHVDRCWARSEKSISFSAPDKNNETIYCETYDSRSNTYCKRLKSLCPEHSKGGLELCMRVCGYPKKWETVGSNPKTMSEIIEQEDPFGDEGCMVKRDLCTKHHKWLPSLRGSVELEKSTLLQKMFEHCHEGHKITLHSEWSTNVLSILMHKEPVIFDHKEYQDYLKSIDSHMVNVYPEPIKSSTVQKAAVDPVMSQAAEFLATLAIQKKGNESTNTIPIATTSASNSISNAVIPSSASNSISNADIPSSAPVDIALSTPLKIAPSETSKSNFSVARLLE